ncbi:caspase recruitment domain-containing protein 9 [Perca fluviatilis]|uniref:caspase recruitment domain-containing protein 9 n=1 Tax=Perca fluviatilis TaxID=8168 RepID=UPI0019667A93|nr:caspase recruitment domain-containing protein 9 [Perca fluviatilis]
MEGVSEDDLCWLQLDDFRMLLIKTIEPSRITPYLRQCQVISAEDEEQLFNDPGLVIRRRKVGALLDILQRTGVKGYTAFLESLELDYPQLYSRITGKEPNKTFSILIDTAGESGLTAYTAEDVIIFWISSDCAGILRRLCVKKTSLWTFAVSMAPLSSSASHHSRKLWDGGSRDPCLMGGQQLPRSSEHCLLRKQFGHFELVTDSIELTLMDNIEAPCYHRDMQIEVERLKHTVRLLKQRTLRPLQESRSLVLPRENFSHLNRLEEKKEETQEEKKETQEEKKEDRKEETQQKESPAPVQMNLLTSVFKLRRDLHRAEEQRDRSVEEKEELQLLCAQLKGDARMYRQRNKQTLRQLEEVIRERDKALASRTEQQEEARLLLQEKDQYRETVRQLTERSDRLELLLLSSQGEELQLRTRLRRLSCNTHHCERSSEEEEEPAESAAKGESQRDELHTQHIHTDADQWASSGRKWDISGDLYQLTCVPCDLCTMWFSGERSGDNEEVAALQDQDSPGGGPTKSEHRPSTDASWDEKTGSCLPFRSRPNFFYRRKRALRSKFTCRDFNSSNHDDSSGSDITDDSD